MTASINLSSSITVARYRKLADSGNRVALGKFIVERFDERYFRPIENSPNKHGFTILAIACIVIETLESFYQGLPDTRGKSAKMFRDFFVRNTALNVLWDGTNWFYEDIRCGILHQSESRGGWRVLRRGPLLDTTTKAINATALLRVLQLAVDRYANQLQSDNALWQNFLTKMKAVCANCT